MNTLDPPPAVSRDRALRVHVGPPLAELDLSDLQGPCLLVSARAEGLAFASAVARVVNPRGLAGLLGTTWGSVILDGRGGLDPDLLGQTHGLVVGGGTLVLLLDATPATRSDARLRRLLAAPPGAPTQAALMAAATVLPPSAAAPGPTPEQAAFLVSALALISADRPPVIVLEAHRGRGKSAALGLLLAALAARAAPHAVHLCLASGSSEGLGAVTAFLGAAGHARVQLTTPEGLSNQAPDIGAPPPIIALDEAAAIPLPRLRRIFARHPDARFVFATTTHGYEGTGRGFVLRFLAGLAEARPDAPPARFTLHTPVRWDPGDTLEPRVFGALGLDAEPAPRAAFGAAPDLRTARHLAFDRDTLAADEPRLREVFGLLLHAHYRTTPRDLATMLDAPDLSLHALELAGHIAAVGLVAHEPPMGEALARRAAAGQVRLTARALGDSLAVHLGLPGVADLTLVRSVRIATHPELRRLGLASALTEAVHAAFPDADLFGTLFGATAGTIAFRRTLGYEVARVSASRGVRSGEPSVLMLRPVTARGAAVLAEARHAFARNWPRARPLLEADGVVLEPELTAALEAGLAPPPTITAAAALARVWAWCASPRTLESDLDVIHCAVAARTEALAALPPPLAAILRARVLDGLGWEATAVAAGLAHAGLAMRQLRPAVRALLAAAP